MEFEWVNASDLFSYSSIVIDFDLFANVIVIFLSYNIQTKVKCRTESNIRIFFSDCKLWIVFQWSKRVYLPKKLQKKFGFCWIYFMHYQLCLSSVQLQPLKKSAINFYVAKIDVNATILVFRCNQLHWK